ncbi:RDD family protein [Candidatus Magnetominusculus dajiuhuensis]|uniref:RDD family protein n=1 Tax=Candidatus Magnetominusculus dajiuhuensis TaxID=3137712 RepID=UPI003B43D561
MAKGTEADQFIDNSSAYLLLFPMGKEEIKAGVLPRILAKSIDFVLAMLLMELLPRVGFYAAVIFILIGDSLYNRASIGKKLMGMEVKSLRGQMVSSARCSILRNSTIAFALVLWKIPILGWFFFIAIAGIEFIIMIGNANRMRIGDELAKTKVVEILFKEEQ